MTRNPFKTPGGRAYLRNLEAMGMSETTRKAVEKAVAEEEAKERKEVGVVLATADEVDAWLEGEQDFVAIHVYLPRPQNQTEAEYVKRLLESIT